MSAPVRRHRRSTAAAVALTAGITASAALMLSACGPAGGAGAHAATPSATGTRGSGSGPSPSGSATPASPSPSPSSAGAAPTATTQPVAAAASVVNGTAHNGLTISDGSRYVVMNGTRVDFGTLVRDLAWSPDGRKAAFIDGDGDLAVSNADGSGRVVAARNPGGQTWSHPTWQVRPSDGRTGYPPANNLFFAVRAQRSSKLYEVTATAHQGTPQLLPLGAELGVSTGALPHTGNVWPSAAGHSGAAVYANQATGEVYIRDDYLRQQGSALTTGSEPAMSSGQDIVFVRSVGGHDHLFVEHPTDNGPTYRDITPHAVTDYTEPAWSPDGRTIAARTVQGVVTLPADGSQAPVVVSGYHGLPAYRAS